MLTMNLFTVAELRDLLQLVREIEDTEGLPPLDALRAALAQYRALHQTPADTCYRVKL